MEQALRCNNQKGGFCRAELTGQAVVTTCSHIFCPQCADSTGLAHTSSHDRQCPVCSTPLPNQNDAVQTQVNPSEDYKTSVLSGLDPTTIMECAGRALAFWTYQTTHEIFYQQYLCKNMTEKYTQLSTAMDKIINDANAEISTLQNKLAALSVEQKALKKRYEDLVGAYQDKGRKHAQTQQLYDALKRRVLMKQVETALSDNVNDALPPLNTHQRPSTYQNHHSYNISQSPRDKFGDIIPHQPSTSGGAMTRGRLGNMPPPPPHPHPPAGLHRPAHAPDRLSPQHRTLLSRTARPTANRSQIPLSTTRLDSRQSLFFPQQQPVDPVLNHTGSATGSATPRQGGGGISSGIKIGTR